MHIICIDIKPHQTMMNRRTKHDHITEGWTLSGQFSLTQSPGSATGAPCRPVTVTYGEIWSKLLPFSRSLAYQFHVSQPFNLDSKLEFLVILDILFKKNGLPFCLWLWSFGRETQTRVAARNCLMQTQQNSRYARDHSILSHSFLALIC